MIDMRGVRSLPAALGLGLALALAGCDQPAPTAALPEPVAMTAQAVGYYCNMNVLEHAGPKAQMHLAGLSEPIWFSQVRDAVVYTRMPEETYKAVAIYVNDMARAASWETPGEDNWIDVREALFVIGSGKFGGMGAPEAIPFGTSEAAASFVALHGGKAVRFDDIPDAYVLAPVNLNNASLPHAGPPR